jgi:signal transduction histidine kinase/GAF domain-containing protein
MRQVGESFYAAQCRVLELIAKGGRLPDALDAIVRLIEAQASGLLCSILLFDEQNRTLLQGAAPRLPPEYVKLIDGQQIGPAAGSCGAAAALRERVIVEDIATHPNWELYREVALRHRLRACWSSPIFSAERSLLGTFAVYYEEKRKPSSEELAWVDEATHLTAVAIMHDRDASALRESEARAQKLMRLYDVASSINEAIVKLRKETEICRAACQIAVEKGLAPLAWVGVYLESEDRIEPLARFGNDSGYLGTIALALADERVNRGPAARALLGGAAAITNDITVDPGFYFKQEAADRGFCACAAFPLRLAQHKRGVFVIYGDTLDFFQSEEVKVLSGLAEHIAFAIGSLHSARERELLLSVLEERTAQLERTERRLSLLDQLGEQMRLTDAPEQVLPLALRMLGQHLGVSGCAYGDVDPDGDRCTIPHDYTAEGVPSIAGVHRFSTFGPRLTGLRQTGEPIVMRDVRDELADGEGREMLLAAGVHAWICCTLVRQGTVRAIMAVRQTTPRAWTQEEINTVQTFVERCWTTIEQRAAEARLRDSESLLRIASEAAHLGGFSITVPDGQITWSDEVCRIHEVPEGTVPSAEQAQLAYAPEYRKLIKKKLITCAREGTPFDIDAQIVTARGRPIWVRASGRAEQNAQGVITRVRGALQDISERRALEDQLRQSQKMEAVGQLAGGVAHDFNNILSVILSCAHFLSADLDPKAPMQADIEQICKAAEGAGELTRKLLAFSRKQMLAPRVVDLNQIVGGLERMLRRLIGDRIELSFATQSTLGKTLADPGQIEQVLMNLVVNARDALSDDGSLTIETANARLTQAYADAHPGVMAGRYVSLTVADTGAGMDAATRARIFEPFFTTKETGKGTGLGLSTVYGIVAQSGGHIAVTSQKGVGTAFKIYLPRVDREVDAATGSPARPSSLRGHETVLVVEDDDQVRAIVHAILARNDYRVLLARNGAEALLISEQQPTSIDLLLTDTVMPRMGGRELAERLRPLRPSMKIMFMSGYTEDATLQRDASERGDAFLPKPITPEALLWRVRDLLDQS